VSNAETGKKIKEGYCVGCFGVMRGVGGGGFCGLGGGGGGVLVNVKKRSQPVRSKTWEF